MDSKKILIIIESIHLGGGAEKKAIDISNELTKMGYEVILLNFYKNEPNYPYEGDLICVNEKRNKRVTSILKKLFYSRPKFIAKYCKNHNIDVSISFMEFSNYPNIISSKIYRNKAKIIICHENFPDFNVKSDKFRKFMYKKADLLVTLSNRVNLAFKEKYSLKNSIMIYNPFDINHIKKKSNELLDDNEKKFFIHDRTFIMVARFVPIKNHLKLLDHFKEILKIDNNFRLILIGYGNLEQEIQDKIIQTGLNSNVFLLGKKENPHKYVKMADFSLLYSDSEGFGNVIVEAMCCDTPVISTDCYGPREIIAPELEIDETISYPYISEHGILLENVNKNNNSLLPLAKLIIKDSNLLKINTKRYKEFSIEKITKIWEKNIF